MQNSGHMVSIKKLLAGISGSHGTMHTIVYEGLTVPQALSSDGGTLSHLIFTGSPVRQRLSLLSSSPCR